MEGIVGGNFIAIMLALKKEKATLKNFFYLFLRESNFTRIVRKI